MTLDIGDEPGYVDDLVSTKLFIGGLSWETTVEKLSEYFCRFGEVNDCVVMKNAETGRSRGFGFVTFKDPSCVQIVMASGPHSLDGRTIDPKECNPKSAQKGKREAKVGNFPKVFLGGLPANVNESVLREFFSKYGKVVEVVIMYDQEKKKTRGFGFLSFDNEETIDKVVAEHFVNIHGKQVEIKRAEPRDKATGKPLSGHMMNSQMQSPGGGHPMSSSMPPWNPMWGPQPGPPMHVPPPPGQPPPPPQTGAPIPTMPNGIMPSGYPPNAWNSSQQTGAYAAGNGWTQPPSYQNYQQWTGYGYPPQGWAQGYSYAPYNTAYPGYGQTTGQTAVAGQTPVAQSPMSGTANAGSAVGAYMAGAGVAANITGGAQPVIPTIGTSVPQVSGATIGSYPQEASSYGPSRVGSYASAPNYANYALQGQSDASNVANAYGGANPSNPSSAPYTRASSQAQGYHPYRRV